MAVIHTQEVDGAVGVPLVVGLPAEQKVEAGAGVLLGADKVVNLLGEAGQSVVAVGHTLVVKRAVEVQLKVGLEAEQRVEAGAEALLAAKDVVSLLGEVLGQIAGARLPAAIEEVEAQLEVEEEVGAQ